MTGGEVASRAGRVKDGIEMRRVLITLAPAVLVVLALAAPGPADRHKEGGGLVTCTRQVLSR